VQPSLASGAAEDHFQDRGPCMEMYPWRRTCLSTGRMYTSAECPRSSSFTVCRCGAAESADIYRPVELQLPWSYSVEQSAVCSALSLNTFTRQLKTYLFGQYLHTPPGAVVAFCGFGAVYICHDLLTYLLKTVNIIRLHYTSNQYVQSVK